MFANYRAAVLFILLGAACLPSSAAAAAEVIVTPTLGYRTGSSDFLAPIACVLAIGFPCPNEAELDDGETFGLNVGWQRSERWRLEILLNRQSADLHIPFEPCEVCSTIDFPNQELEIVTLQVGGQRRWRGDKASPFLAAGLGVSSLSAAAGTLGFVDVDEDRPSASLAMGVEVPLTSHLDLRLEARGYWIDLPREIANQDLRQAEVSTGLAIRW